MVMPPEVSTTDQASPTDARVQGNFLREYEQKFADLPEHFQLTTLCSNAGLAKTVEKGQYFTTLDDTELDRLKGSCREYTLPRSDQSSQVNGWIRGNTKIGPVLDVMVCHHQGRYGCGNHDRIPIWRRNLLFGQDREGINKYATERCRKRLTLKVLERRVQGNLMRRQDHNRHQT